MAIADEGHTDEILGLKANRLAAIDAEKCPRTLCRSLWEIEQLSTELLKFWPAICLFNTDITEIEQMRYEDKKMEIKQKQGLGASFLSSSASLPQLGGKGSSFASFLNQQIAKAGKDADDGESNMFASDFAAIEKNGFSAYVRNLEKEKIEKIRKDILDRMGLSEADLSKLPPEQRAMIEDMIAQEIKLRLAASSAMNNSDSGNKAQSGSKAMVGISPDLAFFKILGDQGKNDSFSVTKKEDAGQ